MRRPARRSSTPQHAPGRILGSVIGAALALALAIPQGTAQVATGVAAGLHGPQVQRGVPHALEAAHTLSLALGQNVHPTVTASRAFGVSRPLRDIPSVQPPVALDAAPGGDPDQQTRTRTSAPASPASPHGVDPALQTGSGSGIPPTQANFEGQDIGDNGLLGGAPPDTNGDVGPNNYMQTVNTVVSVYDKKGKRVSGPTPMNSIWEDPQNNPSGEQFNCTVNDQGDPIVQYDQIADRWLLSQFGFPRDVVASGLPAPPYDQCIAISQTSDPSGAYYLYDFRYSETLFNDYPHFGVWPDAYYMTVHEYGDPFPVNSDYIGQGACAFDRAKMLAGDSGATQVCFHESDFDPGDPNHKYSPIEYPDQEDRIYHGQLPADLNGVGYGKSFTGLPPAGEPNFFVQFLDAIAPGEDTLLLFKFHVDFANPDNSWFGTGPGAGKMGVPISIPVADFNLLCGGGTTEEGRACLPQAETAHPDDNLDAISDRLMNTLAYRNFGDHESLVLDHTVDVGNGTAADACASPANTCHAGIRWYELRNPNGATPTLYQQSTWSPDAHHRWMGSINMDQTGGIALGYSETGADIHPVVSYTGRRPSDPLNQMTLGEGTLLDGTGSQSGTGNRWGDYSSMSVDPNGCTFWYTQEYVAGTGSFAWNTRIGSFTLPTCGDPGLAGNASASLVRLRDTFNYTLTVTAGQANATGVQVTDTLPDKVTLLSVTPSKGTCSSAGQTVTCDLGTLSAGAIQSIQLTVHADSAAALTDTANLTTTSPDGNPLNNMATVINQVFDPCTPPGATVADPSGDQIGSPEQDLTSAGVAEPTVEGGAQRLLFTIKVNDLSPVPPNTAWYSLFSWQGVTYYVDMETQNNPGVPQFTWGYLDTKSQPPFTLFTDVGPPESGAFEPDGTITIGLNTSHVNLHNDDTYTAGGPIPVAGNQLGGLHGEVRTLVGGGGTGLIELNDSTGPIAYTLSGNAFCSPNQVPKAALGAAPTSGEGPLPVSFDGSGSTDPDSGDTITSYTFTFGDGTTPVTQATPTVSHTYDGGGTYHATLTVRDSHGNQSDPATVDINVGGPTADVGVKTTGPAKAHSNHAFVFRVAVTDHGPKAAQGVRLIDSLPTFASFRAVSTKSGSCSFKPARNRVRCSFTRLGVGQVAKVAIVVRATRIGRFRNRATVSLNSPADPKPGNNRSGVTTKVLP